MAKAKKVGRVPKSTPAPTAVADGGPKIKPVLVLGGCFCLLVVVLLLYAYTMTSQYVFNDALIYSSVNAFKDKSTFWYKLLMSAVSAPLSQPWLRASYAWDITSFGFAPGWAHAVNICLHAFSCIYFYLFALRICWRLKSEGTVKISPYYFAAAAALLLAVHPLATGSISYVSGRAGVLGAANYFLALDLFLFAFLEEKMSQALVGYALFFVFTLIGIASNLQCLTIPFVAASLCCLLRPSSVTAREWLMDRSYEIVTLLVVGLACCFLFTYGVPKQIDSSFATTTLAAPIYVATQFKMLVLYYFKVCLVPFQFSVYPPFIANAGYSDPVSIAGMLVTLGLVALGFISKQPLIKIGLLLLCANLLPWIFLVQGEIVADSRFYIPLAGLCMIAGFFVSRLAITDYKKTTAAGTVVLIALVALNVWRQTQWASNKRLWRAELKLNQNNARAHAYLASDLLERNNMEGCRKELDKAFALDKKDFVAQTVSGYFNFKIKNYARSASDLGAAIEYGQKAKMSDEELAEYHAQRAKALYFTGDMTSAYKEAALASPFITADPFLYLLNGKSLLAQNQPLQALQTLEEGVKLDPTNAEFLVPIAQAALDTGMPQVLQHAYAASHRAIQVRAGLPASKLYIRSCLMFGRPNEAVGRLRQLRKTDPEDAELMWLDAGYHQIEGKTNEAETLRKAALAKDPSLAKRMKLTLEGVDAKSAVPAVLMPKR